MNLPWRCRDGGGCSAAIVRAASAAERVADIDAVRRAAPGRALIPLIETAAGFDHLRALAGVTGVQRLAFGSIDFQLDLGISEGEEGDGTALLFFRSQLVLASRLASLLPPIDGVTTALDDDLAVTRDAQAARRLGFGTNLCIHPRQVAAVNAGFTPSDVEVDWARRVVAAVERSGGAAVAVDGKMVDKPVLMRARAVLGVGCRPDRLKRQRERRQIELLLPAPSRPLRRSL